MITFCCALLAPPRVVFRKVLRILEELGGSYNLGYDALGISSALLVFLESQYLLIGFVSFLSLAINETRINRLSQYCKPCH